MITQISKNTLIYTVSWYNGLYISDILLTYFLIRLKIIMKSSPKGIKIEFTGKNLTHVEKVKL